MLIIGPLNELLRNVMGPDMVKACVPLGTMPYGYETPMIYFLDRNALPHHSVNPNNKAETEANSTATTISTAAAKAPAEALSIRTGASTSQHSAAAVSTTTQSSPPAVIFSSMPQPSHKVHNNSTVAVDNGVVKCSAYRTPTEP